MQTLDKYYSQGDEFIHPLWLGILILFSVIIIIGTLCCLRIKCGSQLCHLLTRLFGRNIETNGKYGAVSNSGRVTKNILDLGSARVGSDHARIGSEKKFLSSGRVRKRNFKLGSDRVTKSLRIPNFT